MKSNGKGTYFFNNKNVDGKVNCFEWLESQKKDSGNPESQYLINNNHIRRSCSFQLMYQPLLKQNPRCEHCSVLINLKQL